MRELKLSETQKKLQFIEEFLFNPINRDCDWLDWKWIKYIGEDLNIKFFIIMHRNAESSWKCRAMENRWKRDWILECNENENELV